MNTLESYSIANPKNITDECAKFVIDDTGSPFILSNITTVDSRYAFSFWIKSEDRSSIRTCGKEFASTTEWQKHFVVFKAARKDLIIEFLAAGTYYIYHPKLELGNTVTDWTPAPEDVDSDISDVQAEANKAIGAANDRVTAAESLIQQLSNCISMLVTDENGGSLMTQTATGGWTFSMAETNAAMSSLSSNLETLQSQTGSTKATVDVLQQTINDHGATLEYVNISTFEDEPCIELGESDSDFKLLITNTRIMFRHGSSTPTYINTNGLVTQNIEVRGELIQGGYVQLNTPDGGWGLLWKGVSS